MLFGVTHKWGARCDALFCEVISLSIASLSEILKSPHFKHRFKDFKGHFRGSTDRGALATQAAYVDKMESYNKVSLQMQSVSACLA